MFITAHTGSTITMLSNTTATAGNDPWVVWVGGTTSATTSIFIQDPWSHWNTSATTPSITITGADLWSTWNTGVHSFTEAIELGMRRAEAENPEVRAARERQRQADHAVWETRRRQGAAKRQAANERAEKLLVSILSTAQREQYTKERRFTVHLPNGNRYMVRKGRHGNIERIDEQGKRIENLCVHVAPHKIPDCDNMAAQKLMLESNEPELRRIANISRY